ncbi:MAG: hypothetical protein ACK5ZY_16795 [Cyclobacteriaceae bacterium]
MPRLSGIDSGPGAHAPRVGTGAKRTPEQPEKPPKRKIRPATPPSFVVFTTQRDESRQHVNLYF